MGSKIYPVKRRVVAGITFSPIASYTVFQLRRRTMHIPRMSLFFSALAAVFGSHVAIAQSSQQPCVNPVGIDDGKSGALLSTNIQPLDGLFDMFFDATVPWAITHETPIQFHLFNTIINAIYTALASYEPKALDPWARVDIMAQRRRCKPSNEDLFQLHRKVTVAYVALFEARFITPSSVGEPIIAALANLGIDTTKCKDNLAECDDLRTPWGLAYACVNDTISWRTRDGWNRDGTLTQTFNAKPYSDWRDKPYHPVNAPWAITDNQRWTPLLEHNGLGYLFHQTHIVPHLGNTGKSYYFSDKEQCKRTLWDPRYNLTKELLLSLDRTARLNDKKKMEIEFFDIKTTSFPPLLNQYWDNIRKYSPFSFARWTELYGINVATYESTILTWRIKIEFDLIRPQTVAKMYGKGMTAMAYAGPGAGIQEIPVEEWQPYVRTMPHSEYPSLSACLCGVLQEYGMAMSGKDELDIPLCKVFAAGSSTVEPGITPAQSITLSWSKWSEISDTCEQSRLNAGVHFPAAISAGKTLCSGLGKSSYEILQGLAKGIVPNYVTRFDSALPVQQRCT